MNKTKQGKTTTNHCAFPKALSVPTFFTGKPKQLVTGSEGENVFFFFLNTLSLSVCVCLKRTCHFITFLGVNILCNYIISSSLIRPDEQRSTRLDISCNCTWTFHRLYHSHLHHVKSQFPM